MVDATRCFFGGFFGCTVASRGGYQMARGRHYAKLSLSNAARLSFSDLCSLLFMFLSLCRLCVCVFLCSHWSLVDVRLIFFCPADHVPDWQPRVLLGMVEARSVNVKKTTTTTTTYEISPEFRGGVHLFNRSKIVWINRVSLPILLDVSWTGKINIPLSLFAPEDLISRDGFSCPVPRQPAHSPYSG